MTTHKTADGYITLIDQWGHGRAARGDWNFAPATLISDDGDGHYTAWKVEGSLRAAAEVAGRFDLPSSGNHVMMFSGSSVWAVATPDAFWVEDGQTGDVEPNLAAHPDVVAY